MRSAHYAGLRLWGGDDQLRPVRGCGELLHVLCQSIFRLTVSIGCSDILTISYVYSIHGLFTIQDVPFDVSNISICTFYLANLKTKFLISQVLNPTTSWILYNRFPGRCFCISLVKDGYF